ALLPAAVALAQAVNPAPGLEGLWVARERYGPDARDPLRILPRDGRLIADIAGFTVPVRQQGKSLSFELPDESGSFRGVRSGTAIEGQWIQDVTRSSGARYATPIVLRADGRGGWRAEVV